MHRPKKPRADSGDRVGEAWHVYIVQCEDGTLYCGMAIDVPMRVAAHNAGRGAKYTRGRRPVKLVYARKCVSRAEAAREEARLKRLGRRQKLAIVALAGIESPRPPNAAKPACRGDSGSP